MFETISSVQNPRVKNLVKLRDGGHRRRQKRFLVEGCRETSRALACSWSLETLFFCEELFKDPEAWDLLESCEDSGTEIIRLTPDAFAKASYRQGPDGLLATARQRAPELASFSPVKGCLLVVLEAMEKPGNLGAIFRSAGAAGADAIILTRSVTDPYNPNVIRASQGAFFQLPFYQSENAGVFDFLEAHDIRAIPTSPAGGKLLWEADLSQSSALVFGSEERGLSEDWLDRFTAYKLPMQGVTDSLNVAAMAAISLFEAVRQRSPGFNS